jgi:hypothetical protein
VTVLPSIVGRTFRQAPQAFLDQTSRTLWAAAAAPNPLKSGLVVFGGGVTPITLRIAPEKIAIGQANHSLQSSDRSGK